jgi:hypothetical protein
MPTRGRFPVTWQTCDIDDAPEGVRTVADALGAVNR